MNIKIFETAYKSVKAIAIESERLAIKVIPASGGKIQSIYDKKLQKELLFQSPAKEFKMSAYDSNFGDGDASGFDDVFPSIEKCYYPLYPWRGIEVPDHGEVWSLPWSYEIEGNTLRLSVNGVRFPYRLVKAIEFQRDGCFRISYWAENVSDFEFAFIWAPHILLVRDEDSKIVLPKSVRQVFSTCTIENKLGKFGTMHSWPYTIVNDQNYDISKGYPMYPGKCEKYYAMGRVQEGWCALHNSVTGDVIGLSYPIGQVPYLGIWEGMMNGNYVTALEPCTGDLDQLDTAIQWNRVSFIKKKSVYHWHLNVTIDTVDHIRHIDINGDIQ